MRRGGEAVAIASVFTALAAFFVSARLITRLFIVKHAGAEDMVIFVALLSSAALTVLIGFQSQNGLGEHMDALAEGDLPRLMQQLWASIIPYTFGLMLVKVSILAQYQRFLVRTRFRIACWTLLALITTYGIATIIVNIFACAPVAFFWDRSIEGGKCISLLAFWFTNSSWNILTDILVCVLPLPVINSLNLPKRQRYSLIAVFVLGGFGCITSILRLHSLYVIANSTDVSYDNVGAATWSSVEMNVGIVCASLPTLRPLITHFFPRLLQSTIRRKPASLEQNSYLNEASSKQYGPGNELSQTLSGITRDKKRPESYGFQEIASDGSSKASNVTGEP